MWRYFFRTGCSVPSLSRWLGFAVLGGVLMMPSCASRSGKTPYPTSQSEIVAKEMLEFHEDRFLLEHNEELAQAWKQYRAARTRLVELWRRRAQVTFSDESQRNASDREIEKAKAEFLKRARALEERSERMAREARGLLKAANRIPPVLPPRR